MGRREANSRSELSVPPYHMKHTQKICNSRYLDNVGLPLHKHTYKHGMGRTLESSTWSQPRHGWHATYGFKHGVGEASHRPAGM